MRGGLERRFWKTAWAWMLALCCGLASAPSARALTLAQVDLVSFQLGGAVGLTPSAFSGNPILFQSSPANLFVSAANAMFNPQLSIVQNLGTVHQNPQGSGGNATPGAPFIADSSWTITNTTQNSFASVVLLFTKVDLTGGYPNVPVGLDGNLIQILDHVVGTTHTYFAAMDLGPLAAFDPNSNADSTTITVRYIVGGNLPISGGNLVMPPLSVTAVVDPTIVPEPGTLLFLVSGLAALAASRTRRWR